MTAEERGEIKILFHSRSLNISYSSQEPKNGKKTKYFFF